MSTQISKRALFSKGALSAGIGVSALALLAQRASADTNFTGFAFPATGAPTARTLPTRLADVVNVLDYGADPTFVADSRSAIQAAFDAAFGTAASPHGLTNAHLNKAVFIPNGRYKLWSGPLIDAGVRWPHLRCRTRSNYSRR